jgi:hypothetical protein
LKSLQLAGAGEFLAGRRGHSSRIRWTCDLVRMSKEALADGAAPSEAKPVLELVQVKQEAKTETKPEQNPIVVESKPHKDDTITMSTPEVDKIKTYWFPLRQNQDLHIELPRDLSATESARLAQFVQSLGH